MNISQLLLNTFFGDQDSILVLGDFCEENNVCFQELVNTDVEESLLKNYYDYDGYVHGYGFGDGLRGGYGYGGGDGYGDGYSCDYDGNGCGYGYCDGIGVKEFYI